MLPLLMLLVPVPVPNPAGRAGDPRVQIGVKRRVEGCERRSRRGDTLHVHYTGAMPDGRQFDQSGEEPFSFTLGSGQVIRGWEQGLLAMCAGEKRKLVVPPELGYGEAGAPPDLPGGATLAFEVELVSLDRTGEEL